MFKLFRKKPKQKRSINEKIKEVALIVAKEKNIYIEDGQHRYLKHLSQGEIIEIFSRYNVAITPYQTADYFTSMGDNIKLISEKNSFVYPQEIKKGKKHV